MNTENANDNQDHLPEPSPWAKLLIALGVATVAYLFVGGGGFLASLLGSIGHTLPPLLETLWHAGLRWLQKSRKQKPLTQSQVRALILCGVALAVGVGVPGGHLLTHSVAPVPRHNTASVQ